MSEQQLSPEQFAVGETAVFHRPGSRFHGCLVTITHELRLVYKLDWKDGSRTHAECYGIDGPFGPPREGKAFCASPEHLRKLSSDRTTSTWSECVWKPQQVNA